MDRARLYRNDAPRQGHWLAVRALDPRLKRDALGARVTTGDGRKARGTRRCGFVRLPGEPFALGSLRPRRNQGRSTASRCAGPTAVKNGSRAERSIKRSRCSGAVARRRVGRASRGKRERSLEASRQAAANDRTFLESWRRATASTPGHRRGRRRRARTRPRCLVPNARCRRTTGAGRRGPASGPRYHEHDGDCRARDPRGATDRTRPARIGRGGRAVLPGITRPLALRRSQSLLRDRQPARPG